MKRRPLPLAALLPLLTLLLPYPPSAATQPQTQPQLHHRDQPPLNNRDQAQLIHLDQAELSDLDQDSSEEDGLRVEEEVEESEEEADESGWTESDLELCSQPSSASSEPCWHIWLNPLTPIRTEVLHRNPNVYFFHRLFLPDLAHSLVATVNGSHDFQVRCEL